MDLNKVAVFSRVVDAGSFTGAARHLGLPKSSVSRAVKQLEEELGVRLLNRTTRQLRLTDAGRLYHDGVSRALIGLEDARAAVSAAEREPTGTVRITAPVDLAARMLTPILGRFVRQHPGIKVDLVLTNRYIDLVSEGIDLALRAGRLEDSTLIVRPLGLAAGALFASPVYLKRRGVPKRVTELGKHDCVLFRPQGERATWELVGPRGPVEVEVDGAIRSDDFSFVFHAVAEGLGIGILPLGGCERAARLERVLPEYAMRGVPLQIVYPSGRFLPHRVVLLRDAIVTGILGEDLARVA